MCRPISEDYNLLEEGWIPVLYRDGRRQRVSLFQALTEACAIRQIAATNPMDRVALLRFLLAVLMWCKENAKSSLAALDPNSAGIPREWLGRVQEHEAAFRLLGDAKRFYQDESVRKLKPRPVADLFVEFPGTDSVNHMRHVFHDGSYGFCPACCAMGILRLSVWAPANQYYPASINPGSAAYAFAEGNNFLLTLWLNLPATNPSVDWAPWLGNEMPTSPDEVTRLAWRPRKLWLDDGRTPGICANCGQASLLIKSLCIARGWPTPITTGQALGREVLQEFQKLNGDYKSKGTDKRKLADKVAGVAPLILKRRMSVIVAAEARAGQAPTQVSEAARIAHVMDQLYAAAQRGDRVAAQAIETLTKRASKHEREGLNPADRQVKKFWVHDPHLLRRGEPIALPDFSRDVAVHASKFWRDAWDVRRDGVTAIGIVGDGQYCFYDAHCVRVPDTSAERLMELTNECAAILGGNTAQPWASESEERKVRRRGILRSAARNPDAKHPELAAALKLLTAHVEVAIREHLCRTGSPLRESAEEHAKWLYKTYAPLVKLAIASVTPGSALRRLEARNRALALLKRKVDELCRAERVRHTDKPVVADSSAVTGRPTGEVANGSER